MTEVEAKERCHRLGLRIRQLPCKAWHLIGNGIDLVITDLRNLTDRDLLRYEEPDDDDRPTLERKATARGHSLQGVF